MTMVIGSDTGNELMSDWKLESSTVAGKPAVLQRPRVAIITAARFTLVEWQALEDILKIE